VAASVNSPTPSRTNWLVEVFRFFAIPLAIVGVGIGIAVIMYQFRVMPQEKDVVTRVPAVQVVKAESYAEPLIFEVDGRAVAYKETQISALVSGRIAKKYIEDGQLVARNERLLEIEPYDLESSRKRFEAQLNQIDAQITETDVKANSTRELVKLAEQELAVEQRDFNRLKSLRQGAVSEAEFDAANQELLRSQNALQTLQNELSLLSAQKNRIQAERALTVIDLNMAKRDEERAYITAPFQGVIISDDVEVDAYVTPGQALVTMEDTSKIEVECDLRLDQLRWIWVAGEQNRTIGALENASRSATYPVSFQENGGDFRPSSAAAPPDVKELPPPNIPSDGDFSSGDGLPGVPPQTDLTYTLPKLPVDVILSLGNERFVWQGKLVRYQGSGINPRTRTVPCIVQVDDPRDVKRMEGSPGLLASPPALIRGMFVSLQIKVPSPVKLLALPTEAVGPGEKVMIYRGGKLDIQKVRVVRVTDGKTLVISQEGSIEEGDQVIVTPLPAATPNMDIEIQAIDEVISPSDAASLVPRTNALSMLRDEQLYSMGYGS
jgi:multidrug efflux pump subunit AcrA (membrane-fusion protein)